MWLVHKIFYSNFYTTKEFMTVYFCDLNIKLYIPTLVVTIGKLIAFYKIAQYYNFLYTWPLMNSKIYALSKMGFSNKWRLNEKTNTFSFK